LNRNSQVSQSLCQGRKRGSRIQVALFPEVQRLVESSTEIRLQGGDPFTIEPFEALRAATELRQVCGIAPVSHDEAAVECRTGESPLPPGETLATQAGDEGLGTFELTPRRQHAAGIPGAARGAKRLPAVEYLEVQTIRKGGGSDLYIVIASPLMADDYSRGRLLKKFELYATYISTPDFQAECGVATPENTAIVVKIHPDSAPEIFDLLESMKPWVLENNASLKISPLD